MVSPKEVDISNLLTILSVISAVGALITKTHKLRIRFCIAWYDYLVGGLAFFLVHYLVFAPVLNNLGMYYSFGHWKWGLDSTSAVYLIILLFSFYIFIRTRFTAFSKSKIHILKDLIVKLIITKRYDDLVLLVDPLIEKLILLSEKKSCLDKLYRRYYRHSFNMHAWMSGQEPPDLSRFDKALNFVLDKIKLKANNSNLQAKEVLFSLVTSLDLTEKLAINYPYLCLRILKSEVALRQDFISHYIDSLLSDRRSRIYVELRNSQQINIGSRLVIPESNKIITSLLANAEVARKNEVYRAIGESVCKMLNEDNDLVSQLNKPLGSYSDTGKYSCPINSGITLFEIMVHEGIHQGLQDHLWLHYYSSFTKDIINQMVVQSRREYEDEFPTRFHYLLYRMVSISTEWIEQCSRIDREEIPLKTISKEGFDVHYISKEATKALGNMLEVIIESEKISDRFKVYLLEIIVRTYIIINSHDELEDVSLALLRSLFFGVNMRYQYLYLKKLGDIYYKIDHVLRSEDNSLEEFLKEQLRRQCIVSSNSYP